MKEYKAKVIMTGREYKQFITGIEDLDDDEYYVLIFHAKTLMDYFRFYWAIIRKHKATITRH